MRSILATIVLASGLAAQDADGAGARLLAAAADADRDGRVTAEERRALVDRMGADEAGRIDAARAKALVLLRALDTGADGAIGAAELDAAATARAEGRARGAEAVARAVVRAGADADGDGEVGESERDTLRGLAGENGLSIDTLAGWVATATADVPEDRNAFTPSTFLLTLDGWLDVDRDGAIEVADVEAAFATLDVNGDGAISAEEQRRSAARWRRAGRADYGEITAAAKERAPAMPWQRDLDDAWALVESTGKPLLICVNMDGETASESFAWLRYRDPRFAALAEGFVCVVASPDRHAARDHDDHGRRIADPRFGRVVCSEHETIEPLLFERFFSGRRVAPRHVGVAPDGEVLFDIFLVTDLSVVDAALSEHGRFDVTIPAASELDERALLDSRDAAHRDFLEARFVAASAKDRTRLARRCLHPELGARHPEIVRIALRDAEAAVRDAAVAALAEHGEAGELPLAREAFRAAFGDDEATERLLAWLGRVGDPARQERVLQQGLAAESTLVDREAWLRGIAAGAAEPAPTPEERDALDERLEELSRQRREQPTAAIELEIALLTLRYADATAAGGGDPSFLMADAQQAAQRAVDAGSEDALAQAVLAVTSANAGETDVALGHALAALPELTTHAASRVAGQVLGVIARERTRAVYAAMADAETDVTPSNVADARAAFEVLSVHDAATQDLLVVGLDFLNATGGWGLESRLAPRAVERFPHFPDCHDRWRAQLLRDEGAAALERAYAGLQVPHADAATLSWFRGFAFHVAGDRHVEDGRIDEARRAYEAAVQAFEAALAARPEFEESTRGWIESAAERARR